MMGPMVARGEVTQGLAMTGSAAGPVAVGGLLAVGGEEPPAWPFTAAGLPKAVPVPLVTADATTAEVRLAAVGESAAYCRRLVRAALEAWSLAPLTETLELLTDELVSNAVKHAGGDHYAVRLVRAPGRLRVEVRDLSRALPCLILGDLEDENGRGLRVVDKLADRWGADLLSRGKSVWVEMRHRLG